MRNITKTNREIRLSALEYADDLRRAATVGYVRGLVDYGVVSPFISQNKANKLYGKRNVNLWINSGRLKIYKDGDKTSKIRINRIDVEALWQADNRYEYFNEKAQKEKL